MGIMKFILKTANSIPKNKTLMQVLKFISQATLMYMGKKIALTPHHIDRYDSKNVIYQYNKNNKEINPILAEEIFSLHNIVDFIVKYNNKNNIETTNKDIVDFIVSISKIVDPNRNCKDLINGYFNNNMMKIFNEDVKKTSSLIDTEEINEGKLYVPDKELKLSTNEASFIKDNKNEYLENRLDINDNDTEALKKIIIDYHKKNKTKEVIDYFNKKLEGGNSYGTKYTM